MSYLKMNNRRKIYLLQLNEYKTIKSAIFGSVESYIYDSPNYTLRKLLKQILGKTNRAKKSYRKKISI